MYMAHLSQPTAAPHHTAGVPATGGRRKRTESRARPRVALVAIGPARRSIRPRDPGGGAARRTRHLGPAVLERRRAAAAGRMDSDALCGRPAQASPRPGTTSRSTVRGCGTLPAYSESSCRPAAGAEECEKLDA